VEPNGIAHRWNVAYYFRGDMSLLSPLHSWLKWMMKRTRFENEMETEMRFHTESFAHDLIRSGVPEQEARRRARIEFGGLESHKDEVRASLGLRWWDELSGDVRHSLRMMRRNPGFTAVAVLSLALGIGANTAIFSLVYTLLLRTLPVQHPKQLVELLHRYPGEPHLNGFSWQAYQLMRDHSHVFSGLIAAVYQPLYVRGENARLHTVKGGYVNGTFFPVLGVKPALGRLIAPEDDHLGDPSAVAVVSWPYWKSRFDLDPAILGKQIIVENVPVTVVGVTARRFVGLQIESSQDLWLPLSMEPVIHHPSGRTSGGGWVDLVGRLRPGVSIQQADAELSVLYESTLDEQARTTNNPFLRKMKFEIEPAGTGLSRLREEFAKPLLLLMAVVGLLLMIMCTNLASMLLARGAAREHEMALRVSLGASRFRLVRQVLTESVLLSVTGSLVGIVLAYFATGALVRIIIAIKRPGPPVEFQVRTDATVLFFTAAIALLTGLLFGLVPALRAMGTVPAPSLRQVGKTGENKSRRLLGKTLVVTQVALSVVLLSTAGLFIRYLSNLERTDLGFQRDHVLLVTLDPKDSGYEGARLGRAYQELLQRLERLPGVSSATICAVSPIEGPGANRGITVQGYDSQPGEIRNVMENWVAPKYFETLGTPLLAGRDFSFQDQDHPRVAIVNQTMAHYYFGNGNPIGRRVAFDGDDQRYEIIGVVGDAKYHDMREVTWRTIYLNTFQESGPASQFALRTGIDPATVAPDVRRTVRDLLKTVSIERVTTLADQVDASIVPERLITTLATFFGALGSALTAIGLYGLLGYTVTRRTNEIGVRMALGASRSNIARMVLCDALGMVLVGLVIGSPIAIYGRTFAASLIQDLPVNGAFPIVFGVAGMIAVAGLAAYVPARRAAGVDPMEALRYE
jgi:putative ABC transport system permease protein